MREQLVKGHISSREERIGMKEKIAFAVPSHKVTDSMTVHDPEPRWETSE